MGGGGDIVIQMIDTMLKVEREKDGKKIEKVEKAETWWQTNEMMVAKMHY